MLSQWFFYTTIISGVMLYMKYLIIDTLSEGDSEGESVVESIKEISKDTEVVYADKLNIKNCCGCTYCWLKTPGVCAIKDDYHIVFEKFLSADNVIIIGESKLGFVSYKVKNIIDRILPIVLPYLTITEGEMRHLPRYDKTWNISLIYKNNGENELLNQWMKRVTLNFHSKSLGAYEIGNKEAWINGISNI